MNDLGEALLVKTEAIIENWVAEVRQDVKIESAKKLSFESVRDSLPFVLKAIATLLSASISDQTEEIKNKTLLHGIERAKQGYDATEIVREYRILRQVIFSSLESDLVSGSASELLSVVQVIDKILDEVISLSLESYIQERLHQLEQVQIQTLLTNQELARLLAAQKNNLSDLSHELKNPLNAMINFSSLLLRQQQQISQGENSLDLQLIERVLKNGQQLLRLINNALETSRNGDGQEQLHIESTSPRFLIQSVTELLSSANQKNLEIIVECDRAPDQVFTDPLRLQQIITNLVSNAIRYTDAGSVRINCYLCGEDNWKISISDTGKGISGEDQAKIFEPYFRVGSQEDYLPESTGLGLAIVSRLVKLLQGEIELVSTLGCGSTFTLTFPLNLKSDK